MLLKLYISVWIAQVAYKLLLILDTLEFMRLSCPHNWNRTEIKQKWNIFVSAKTKR